MLWFELYAFKFPHTQKEKGKEKYLNDVIGILIHIILIIRVPKQSYRFWRGLLFPGCTIRNRSKAPEATIAELPIVLGDLVSSHHLHALSVLARSTPIPSRHVMLPRPCLSFTLPSIHDNTKLDCRVYHPQSPCLLHDSSSNTNTNIDGAPWSGHAAVVAHPYAPLGGCCDDPIVDVAAGTLLQFGFVVATFNFRCVGYYVDSCSFYSLPIAP